VFKAAFMIFLCFLLLALDGHFLHFQEWMTFIQFFLGNFIDASFIFFIFLMYFLSGTLPSVI